MQENVGCGRMEIRKAKKGDLKNYLEIKKESLKEYSKLAGEKIKISKKQVIKEFNEFTSSKNKFILLIKEDKKIIGYLTGSLIKNIYQKFSYIDDIFINKNFRRKSYAKALLKNFIKIQKSKGVKKIRIGVRMNNKKALAFYRKMDFKIIHYEMDKKIK